MTRYFVSYMHENGYGNAIVVTENRINDFDGISDVMDAIVFNNKNSVIRDLVIMNFIALGDKDGSDK